MLPITPILRDVEFVQNDTSLDFSVRDTVSAASAGREALWGLCIGGSEAEGNPLRLSTACGVNITSDNMSRTFIFQLRVR